MKKTIITISSIILVLGTFTSLSFAMRGGSGHHGFNRGNMMSYCQNLTAEEENAVRAEKNNFFNDTKELRSQIFNKRMDLDSALNQESPEASKVTKLRKDLYSLQQTMREKHRRHLEKLNEIVPGFAQNYRGKHHNFKGNGECQKYMGTSWQQ